MTRRLFLTAVLGMLLGRAVSRASEPPRNTGGEEPPDGQYYAGLNHFSSVLQVSKKRYVLQDFRLADERGELKQSGSRLTLRPLKGTPSRRSELIYVPWDARAYLVEPDGLIAFCNAVNRGDEPRTYSGGLYYLREDDWDKKVKGRPKVPTEVKEYLLTKPIMARVLEVKSFRKDVQIKGQPCPMDGYPAIIDRGSQDGLRVGMELGWHGDENWVRAVVTAVAEKRATVLAAWLVTTTEKPPPGLMLSTRPEQQPKK
jgi:hypothetical protein